MGFLKSVKKKYAKTKADVHNKGELAKMNAMFKNMDDTIEQLEATPSEKIVQAGQAKKFFKDLTNVIVSLESSIYKTAIATFCSTTTTN